jgi:hypothetical protein
MKAEDAPKMLEFYLNIAFRTVQENYIILGHLLRALGT